MRATISLALLTAAGFGFSAAALPEPLGVDLPSDSSETLVVVRGCRYGIQADDIKRMCVSVKNGLHYRHYNGTIYTDCVKGDSFYKDSSNKERYVTVKDEYLLCLEPNTETVWTQFDSYVGHKNETDKYKAVDIEVWKAKFEKAENN